jgi:hypothetical protein
MESREIEGRDSDHVVEVEQNGWHRNARRCQVVGK